MSFVPQMADAPIVLVVVSLLPFILYVPGYCRSIAVRYA
jgi:hypothetical protein